MLLIRPIAHSDIDALLALARLAGTGMTTFKADRPMLEQRIAIACASFEGKMARADADYVFVLEDLERGTLAGISAIKAAVGLGDVFYNYRVGTLIHSSSEPKLYRKLDVLYLSNDLTGSAELCSLFLHPAYRNGSNGKLLSKCRLLFMAQFPHLFGDKVFAEMRGFQTDQGRVPFYEAIGRHFFKIPFEQADDLTSLGRKEFIAELMPRQPLYVSYLPDDARAALAHVHPHTAPARRLLEQEGLRYDSMVDIFDGGPVLEARIADLRVMRDSLRCMVAGASPHANEGLPALLSADNGGPFRAIVTSAMPVAGSIAPSAREQQMLGAQSGDQLRFYSLAKPAGPATTLRE